MNVLKIVVDKKPFSCGLCMFSKSIDKYTKLKCIPLDIILFNTLELPGNDTIPINCPLVVEVPEVCEWGSHKYDDFMDDWEFCPKCGKPIKYIESD